MMFSQTRSTVSACRKPGLVARVLSLLALQRQRRSLANLDARLLADVGLTREQAHAEMERPIWDAPPNWHL